MTILLFALFIVVLLAVTTPSDVIFCFWPVARLRQKEGETGILGGQTLKIVGGLSMLLGAAIFSFLVYFLYWSLFLSQ